MKAVKAWAVVGIGKKRLVNMLGYVEIYEKKLDCGWQFTANERFIRVLITEVKVAKGRNVK